MVHINHLIWLGETNKQTIQPLLTRKPINPDKAIFKSRVILPQKGGYNRVISLLVMAFHAFRMENAGRAKSNDSSRLNKREKTRKNDTHGH